MGPHGLIVGATGSGKSELLRTMVTAMALTHAPDVLNFVFVDFKGGAAFADLATLPHSAGIVTNLEQDLTLVDRIHAALFGELERRHRMLREAGNLDNIKQYHAKRRNHRDMEPMPYLLVIVDEFGELLANRPEFQELFIAIGRIGRSIGMHLLPYVPVKQVSSTKDLIREFTPTGKLVPVHPMLKTVAGDASVAQPKTSKTDMNVLISRLSTPMEYAAHQVWLPPLPTKITLGRLVKEAGWQYHCVPGRWNKHPSLGMLQVPVGLLDIPADQRREPLLLRSIAAGLMLTHTPHDVQLYAIDFGGGLLRVFEGWPHFGAVCGKADKEKIPQLIRHIKNIIEDRELLFRERGIDGMAAYRALRAAGHFRDIPYGDVFLVVDDIAQLQAELDTIDYDLTDIVTAGLSYGVHVIVTANRWPDIRIKLRDNISGRLELRLNDPVDSEIERAAQAALPAGVPGRGLTRQGLQFQVALPALTEVAPDSDLAAKSELVSLVEQIAAGWDGPAAPQVRVLPELVTTQDIAVLHRGNTSGVPLGIESSKFEPVYFDLQSSDPHLIIMGDSECGKTNLLRHWIKGLTQQSTPDDVNIAVVDYRRMLIDVVDGPHLFGYACTAPMVTEMVTRLLAKLNERMPSSQDLSLAALRNPHRWTGPHYYLFVDDYDWVASQGMGPLSPLVDVLLQARDLGFHLVLTRRLGGTSSSMYEAVFKRLREMGTSMFVMNSDMQEAKLLGCPNVGNLPPGRGYLMRRNQKTMLVQTVFERAETSMDMVDLPTRKVPSQSL
ncbi:type VII secretion protein EccCb [Alicyclobacillus pomorum]|uniref:type VII secretion protein EccCb n=1 Tax=Alicyclobacillus pomorum TaxID=204470 RepID=UPI0003F80A52|nr:type VII secretion protein EccCb [Alicyclobacillus pomorum]